MRVTCTCGKSLRIDESLAGKRVRCPACQEVLALPAPPTAIMQRAPDSPASRPARAGRDVDDWEERPRRRKKRRKSTGQSALVWVFLGVGGSMLMLGLVVFTVVLMARAVPGNPNANPAGGRPDVLRGWPNLREFVSQEGRFKVLMPGLPEEKLLKGEDGTVMKMYDIEGPDGEFLAAFFDMRIPENEPEGQQELRLDAARQGALRKINGRLLREAKARLHDQHLGREVEADLPDRQWRVRVRFFIVGRRMYSVMVIGPRALVYSDDANRFLDSLALTK